LLAKLRWSDKATGAIRVGSAETCIFFDPAHPDSMSFIDSGTESAIKSCTSWVRKHFPSSLRGNMQGELGQLELRGATLFELNTFSANLVQVPFATMYSAGGS